MTLLYVYRGFHFGGCLAHVLSSEAGSQGLTLAPGNVRPADGPYICLVPVLDIWRMSVARARQAGVPHYSEVLEEDLLEDVRTGRAAIVFDLSNEGPSFAPAIFAELLAWMEAHRIPPGKVVWICQNRALREAVRNWAGERADWLRVEDYDYFVKSTAVLFSPLSGRSPFVDGVDAHVARLFDAARKDRLLLCLNATPRVHRFLAIGALIHYRLLDESLVSFPGVGYAKSGNSRDEIVRFVDARANLAFLRPDLEKVFALEKLTADAYSETGNELADKIDVRPYERTFVSLVTETDFTGGQVLRITEKTIKPYALGHPAIILGNPGSTRFATELGFQPWSGLIADAHDAEPDPVERFKLLLDALNRLVAEIRSSPAEWLGRAREIGEHNARHAASGKLLAAYQEIYDKPLLQRLEALTSG